MIRYNGCASTGGLWCRLGGRRCRVPLWDENRGMSQTGPNWYVDERVVRTMIYGMMGGFWSCQCQGLTACQPAGNLPATVVLLLVVVLVVRTIVPGYLPKYLVFGEKLVVKPLRPASAETRKGQRASATSATLQGCHTCSLLWYSTCRIPALRLSQTPSVLSTRAPVRSPA